MYQSTGKIKVPTIVMIGEHDPVEPAGIVQRLADLYEQDFAAAKEAAKSANRDNGYVAPRRQLAVLWSVTPKTWSKFTAEGLPIPVAGTPGTGHTNFTAAQYTFLLDAALTAASTGALPRKLEVNQSLTKLKLTIDRNSAYPWMKHYTTN